MSDDSIVDDSIVDDSIVDERVEDNVDIKGDFTLVNLEEWQHLVKDVIDDYNKCELIRLELYKNDTYPVFYMSIEDDIYDDVFLMEDFLKEMLEANGFWSYEIRDGKRSILVISNPESKLFTIQGLEKRVVDQSFFDNLDFEVYSEFFLDIDKDGLEEKFYMTSIDIYITQTIDGIEYLFDHIDNPFGVPVQEIEVELMNLDNTGEDYIVFIGASYVMNSGRGYRISRFNGYDLDLIRVNYPSATGSGYRYLDDLDGDGVFEAVSEFYLQVTQRHVIQWSERFDGSGQATKRIIYNNEGKAWIQPVTSESTLICFLESYSEVDLLYEERQRYMHNSLSEDEVEAFKESSSEGIRMFLWYNVLNAKIELISENDNSAVYKVCVEGAYDIACSEFHMLKEEHWSITDIIKIP